MNELIVIHDSCSDCGVAFLDSDNFCRNCGLPIATSPDSVFEAELVEPQHPLAPIPPCRPMVAPLHGPSLVNEILGKRTYVIAILLCVGPIGLPALWFSHRFSRRSKIVTTTGYFLFTAVLPIVIAWYFLDVAVRPIVDAFRQ